MARHRFVFALGMVALGWRAACPAVAQAGVVEPGRTQLYATEEEARQHRDATGLSDRVSRVEGRLEGMEATNGQATRSAEGVLATVRWCTIVVSGLITLLGFFAAFVGLRGWQSVREVTKEAEEAVRKANDARRETEKIAQETKAAANEFLQGVQADAEQRLRAAEEMARQQAGGPQGRQERWVLAQTLINSGNPQLGVELLESVAKDDLAAGSPQVSVLNQLSGLLDRLGRYEDAVRYADIAMEHSPDDVGARFNKAVIEIHLGGSATEAADKRRHWHTALRSFERARRLHEAGTRMSDADYGKMWLFAGETAQYLAELEADGERRADFLQRAAAWYGDGYTWMLEAGGRATEHTAPVIRFWANNAHERTLTLHRIDRHADAEGLQRRDIARRNNDIPFWPEGDAPQEQAPAQGAPS